jgi:hypothetical protein
MIEMMVVVLVKHTVEMVLVVLVVEQKMKYTIVVRLVLVDKQVEFEKDMIGEKFAVEYYNIEIERVVQVVDDEEVFAHELNELNQFYKQFLEVLCVVVD